MNEIKLDVRLKQKTNTFAYWSANSDFIPLKGEIIVYSNRRTTTDENGQVINIPDFKVGDGISKLGQLPFLVGTLPEIEAKLQQLADDLFSHVNDASMHVAEDEREL